ncbi:hypothetical protein ES708_34304 [subsurface metagenome]
MSVATKDRIERRELLRLSGMRPCDLKHWVRRGLLPRSCRRYFPGRGGCVSYYPAWALERARYIKRLMSELVPMHTIRDVLAGEKVEL